jgi:HEAT repeat protein
MLILRHAGLAVAATLLLTPPLFAQIGDLEDPFGPFPINEQAADEAETSAPATPTITPAQASKPTAEALLRQYDAVMQSARDAKQAIGEPPLPAPAANPPAVRILAHELHLGHDYAGRSRYLALRLHLLNSGRTSVTIQREAFRLVTRGNELAPGIPQRPGLTRLPSGTRLVDLSEFAKKGPVEIPAGEAIELRVGFNDIPGTGDVPEMTLRLPVENRVAELDLNDYALGLMRLKIERLGPRGLLGLVTVGGDITSVGAGELARVFEKLANSNATRIVLTWEQDAPSVEPDLANWLVQAATQVGGAPGNDGQHPVLSAAIRELHLAALPKGTGVPNFGGPQLVHPTVAAAVSAALGDAFDSMPLDELTREIEGGHPLTRPAAIAAGGRLPDDRLPMLIELTIDRDLAIAKAATMALGGFSAPAAIERLVALAKTGPLEVRSAAVESLAASRFGAAHEALRRLLEASVNGTPVIPPEAVVPVLSNHPRPLWGDALYELALKGEPAVRSEALGALARLGHPELLTALERALQDQDERLRMRAFTLLSSRDDPRSIELAIAFTREHLRTHPPTPEMTALLLRTKDPQSVPLLIEQLKNDKADRSSLIRLLAQIGGLEIRDTLEAVYPTLPPNVRAVALATLSQLRSPKFYEFAEAALDSTEPALVSVVQQQLQNDAGPEAVALLSRTLLESKNDLAIAYAAQGLGNIGTPAARRTLRKAYHTRGARRDAAWRELYKLNQTSPGFEAFVAGEAAREREEWKASIDRYTQAVGLDPQLIDAWAGRANANMQLTNYVASRADYEKVVELDPSDPAAVTCLGILRVMDGRVEEGLAFVRDRSAEFGESDLFAYNTACLYAVASERIEKTDAPRADRLRTDAVKELARAVELGMTGEKDVAWMRKDPDLKSLHGRTDFEETVTAAEQKVEPDDRRRGAGAR